MSIPSICTTMKSILILTFILLQLKGITQNVSGVVLNDKSEPIEGAQVFWLGATQSVSTNSKGRFEILAANPVSPKLIASFVGYLADTIEISGISFVEFRLKQNLSLKEVEISEKRDGIYISDINPIKTEQITQTELTKAACCDLAGCFETQTTVQPQTTNVITNSKELRILGLSGVYNQVLIDGFPLVQGLSYTYGISSIPGTLVDNIYV
jgi:outer membrane receptor for ferrienterochelin and colicins